MAAEAAAYAKSQRMRGLLSWMTAYAAMTTGNRVEAPSNEIEEHPMPQLDWDIRNVGRAWTKAEFDGCLERTPEKLEVISDKLLWSEEDRIKLLGLLLENVGADAAVRLGDPEVWRSAVKKL